MQIHTYVRGLGMEENSSIGLQMLLPRRENPIIPVTYFPFDFFLGCQNTVVYPIQRPKEKILVWKKKNVVYFYCKKKMKNLVKKLVKMWTAFFYVFEYSGWCIFLMSLIIFQVAQERIIFHSGVAFFSVSPSFLQAFARTIWLFYFLGRFAEKRRRSRKRENAERSCGGGAFI